jgi:hypothetical protein
MLVIILIFPYFRKKLRHPNVLRLYEVMLFAHKPLKFCLNVPSLSYLHISLCNSELVKMSHYTPLLYNTSVRSSMMLMPVNYTSY